MIQRNQMRNNWVYIVLTLIISFVGIGIIVFVEGNVHINELSENFREFYILEQKSQLKNEVDSRHEEIAYELAHLQEDYKNLLRGKVLSLANAMKSQPFAEEAQSESQRVSFIKTFEDYVSHDEYLFFVLTSDGVLLRSGTDHRINGIDIIDNVDVDGVYYTREMLEAIDNPEGVYVTYCWPKVQDGQAVKKTSYCYYLEEFDLIIGTGAYEDDIQKDLKDRVFGRLQSYYEGKENYIFINDYSGITYVHRSPTGVGYDFTQFVDVNGLNVHDAFMDVLENSPNGYLSYYIGESNSDEISEKISYVRRVDDWDVYIGMGFHTDYLIDATDRFLEDFNKDHTMSTILTICLLFLTALIVLYLVRRGSLIHTEYTKQEDIIYEQVLNMANDLVIVLNNQGQMVLINKEVPPDVDIDACIKGDKLVIDTVKNDTHVIHGTKRNYYVEINEEHFHYHGENATIYFIKDVTQQYEATNTMEELALHDELTGLPNRRKFIQDIDEMCRGDCEQEKLVIAMIDIDNFKVVNDTYGHKFGDVVLRELSAYAMSSLREADDIYRYGGEEFVFVFRDFELSKAKERLDGINKGFSAKLKEMEAIDISFSGGAVYCHCKQDQASVEERIEKADQLMYEAKRQGRNRILIEDA